MTMEEAVTKRLNKRAASLGPKNDDILIPHGVGHGYKALGIEPVQLLYFTDRHCNTADELRIAYNDPAIAYDWELSTNESRRILLGIQAVSC
jgi:dTDP-4-dehydrorhamnose 3,5-epimerase-like enzyme